MREDCAFIRESPRTYAVCAGIHSRADEHSSRRASLAHLLQSPSLLETEALSKETGDRSLKSKIPRPSKRH
jgi:hypothetical protein